MSSRLLLGSVYASAAFDPHASVNLLSRARATSQGVDETSSVTQLSVTLTSAYSATTTVLPFAIVNDDLEFDIILGKGWYAWTEANSGKRLTTLPHMLF